MTWTEQVAVVTGGARGIGRAVSLELARQGVTVVAADLNLDGAKAVAEEAKTSGLPGKIVPKSLNVTDRTAVEAFVEEVMQEFGKISILVNNAGITRDGLLLNMEDEQFDTVINVNLRSVFLMTRTVCRYMMQARYGRIVNLASVSGMMGNAGQANYAASKAGVIGFTKTVAKELARRNITANAVAPGFIDTEMTKVLPDKVKDMVKQLIPCQKMGEPADVAAGVVFLASPQARYITGQVLVVDGGLNM
ncbi:MAG: 3-oxoacyl-[acyl-carrier-protein] reductase [Planctomycetes bacterium]|nr:3-oxoacyl-[acyl-carrier-protein] reductase [Planctomycetota bacterium]